MRCALIGLVLLATFACAPDDLGGPDDVPDIGTGEDVANVLSSCNPGEIGLIRGSGVGLSELQTLADGFNDEVIDGSGLTASDRSKLRRIVAPGGVPSGTLYNITVISDASGAGTGWCGSNTGGGHRINIWWCFSGGPSDPTALQNRRTAMLHELWNILNHDTNKLSSQPSTAGCAINPGSDPTTTRPCVHEVQYEYAFCGVRGTFDYTSDVVTGVFINGPSSLDEGSGAQYTATFQTTGGGGTPPLESVLNSTLPSQSSGIERVGGSAFYILNPDLNWSSNSFLNVGCGDCNPTMVTGADGGSGKLTVELDPASNVVYPEPKRSKSIAVQAPPPPSPIVTSVSITPSSAALGAPGGPFPVAGTEVELTATAFDQFGDPMSGVTFYWSENSQYTTRSPAFGTSTVITGCSPYPTYGQATVTARASGTSVTGTASITIMKNHPDPCGGGGGGPPIE